MRSIEEYEILVAGSPHVLASTVNKFIENGWQPYGGLMNSDGIIFQVMVKYSNKPNEE